MAVKKEPTTAKYVVIRDCGVGAAGDTVVLDSDTAADLIRDGMVSPAEEG